VDLGGRHQEQLDQTARLKNLRRLVTSRRSAPKARAGSEEGREQIMPRLESLEKRLEHLESMIEGLQDSVHRESVRQGQEIDQLQRNAEPSAIRRALDRDARDRGI
jgi:hypothetical protein